MMYRDIRYLKVTLCIQGEYMMSIRYRYSVVTVIWIVNTLNLYCLYDGTVNPTVLIEL